MLLNSVRIRTMRNHFPANMVSYKYANSSYVNTTSRVASSATRFALSSHDDGPALRGICFH